MIAPFVFFLLYQAYRQFASFLIVSVYPFSQQFLLIVFSVLILEYVEYHLIHLAGVFPEPVRHGFDRNLGGAFVREAKNPGVNAAECDCPEPVFRTYVERIAVAVS